MLVTLTNGYRHHLIIRLEIQKLDVKMLVTLTNGYRHHLIKHLEIQKLDVQMLVTLTNGYRHILKFVIMFRSVKTFWNETHKIIIFSCLGWHWLCF